MPRYVTRAGWVPVIEPDDAHAVSREMLPDLTVEGPRRPRPTGLYDANGDELYRTYPPTGFGRDHEW